MELIIMGIVCIIIALIGLACVFFPYLLWDITERWKTNSDDDPSEAYILYTRICGGGIILLGIGFWIYSFYLFH